MRNFVIINGVSSQTITGLAINELPPITKPEMRATKEEIDGRDGDIITNLGYSAYDKTITIGLFGTGYDINNIVAFFNGEGTIVFSNEPDKYYNFKILNQIDYESLQKFRTASITFHCQPFKYPLSETPLEIEYDYIEDEGENLTLNNTAEAPMTLALKGNTSQSGTPTPTSPIPVSVVSGDNDVVVCGKNLFNLNDLVKGRLDSGVIGYANGTDSITISEDTLTFVTNSGYRGVSTNSYIKVKPQTRYFLSYTTSSSVGFNFACYDSAKTFIGNGTAYGGTSGRFYDTLANTSYVRIDIQLSSAGTCTMEKIQLEENPTATTYERYIGQTYEVDLPVENLLDISDITSGNGITNNGDGSITLQGGVTSNSFSLTTPFVLQANQTYTLSITNTNSSYSASTFILRTGSTNRVVINYSQSSVNYTPTQDITIDTLRIFNGGNTFDNFTFYPQLAVGSKMSKYQPYNTTPIELCKIGNYQDRIYKDNGNWYIEKQIGKIVLDGTEAWEYGNVSGVFFLRTITNYATSNNIPYSNNYAGITNVSGASGIGTDKSVSFINQSGLTTPRFYIKDTTYTNNVNDLKTWLSTHNTTVYYVLASPTTTLIEDNNLIEQLDNLENAMSYEGQTNISQVNNDKAFIISAKALEDGTNEVVVNNIGNVYSKPLLALEGSGNVDIYLDNTQILRANVEDKMNIDIAQLEAYNPDTMTLLNRQVIGNYNSMTLQPGNNTIRIDGALDKATITNYTRYL